MPKKNKKYINPGNKFLVILLTGLLVFLAPVVAGNIINLLFKLAFGSYCIPFIGNASAVPTPVCSIITILVLGIYVLPFPLVTPVIATILISGYIIRKYLR